MSKLVTALALAMLAASPAFAQSYDPAVGTGNIAPSLPLPEEQSYPDLSPAARRGLTFVRVHCAQCHSVDNVSASPLATARPLRALRIRYPVADLQRPLAEGIHPRMPVMRLTAGQLSDVMAYLRALER
jgi:cytochrome c